MLFIAKFASKASSLPLSHTPLGQASTLLGNTLAYFCHIISDEKGLMALTPGRCWRPGWRLGRCVCCQVELKKKLETIIRFKRHSFILNFGHVTWAKCYKTFYGRKLRLFIISQSICSWQAFQAQSNKHSSLLRKFIDYRQKSFKTLATGRNVIKLFCP